MNSRKSLSMLMLLSIIGILTALPTLSVSACAAYFSTSGNLTGDVSFGPWDLPEGALIVVTIQAGERCDYSEGTVRINDGGNLVKAESYDVWSGHSFTMHYTLSESLNSASLTIDTSIVEGDVTYSIAVYADGSGESIVPPDHRLNWRWGDHLGVIYPDSDAEGNPQLHIYGVDDESHGQHLLTIDETDLAPFVGNPPAENTLIASSGIVSVYALSSGEFSIIIGPDADGSFYTYVFDSLPIEDMQFDSWSIYE